MSSQQMKQKRQDENLYEPPITSGQTSKEVCQILRDVEEFMGAPRMGKRECRQLDSHVLVAQVVEPSSYQENAQHQVWWDAIVEDYISIVTIDDWEIVSRLVDRSVMGSWWIYKIKYDSNGSVKKYMPCFWQRVMRRRKGYIMRRCSNQFPNILLSSQLYF